MNCTVCNKPLFGPHSASSDKSPEPVQYYFCKSPPSICRLSGQRFDMDRRPVGAPLIEDAVVKTNEDEGLS